MNQGFYFIERGGAAGDRAVVGGAVRRTARRGKPERARLDRFLDLMRHRFQIVFARFFVEGAFAHDISAQR